MKIETAIEVLEEISHNYLEKDAWTEYREALTQVLTFVKETSEMLADFGSVTLRDGTVLKPLGGDYSDGQNAGEWVETWKSLKEQSARQGESL